MLDIRRLQCRYRSAWLLVGLGTVACGAADIIDPPSDGPPLDFTGTWNPSTNMGGPWGHDGSPVVSDNFLVFSGYASQAARQYASDVAEESLSEIEGSGRPSRVRFPGPETAVGVEYSRSVSVVQG